jgi:serine/threonine protein kinase
MPAETSRLQIDNPNALPSGTRLGEFEVLSLLGVGGFGIVYLAFDHALEREVAIKEYMPTSLAGRTETMHVTPRSLSDGETFTLGRNSFVKEAKMLARFDHPSLLKVHRYWEANGTAYMAMPVLRGRTLKEVRAEMGVAPDEAWLRDLLDPLLGAIERLHSEGVYHRDIAPDNILIEKEGHPVLLDFGAARRVISDKSQTLTAILKPAYAPIEQYAEAGAVKQGPWTDIYALGATLHYMLLGRPPAPATARAVHDDVSALTPQAVPGCSEDFLHTIDWMLAPRPTDRPQSVAALREVLEGRAAPPVRLSVEPAASQWDRTVLLPGARGGERTEFDPGTHHGRNDEATMVVPPTARARTTAATASAATVPAGAASPPPSAPPAPPAPSVPSVPSVPAAPAVARSKMLPLGLGLGAALVVVAALALWPRQPAQTPAADAPALPAVALPAPAPPPPAASVAESTITTVIAPTPAPAATTKSKVEPAADGGKATPPVATVTEPAPNPARPPAAENSLNKPTDKPAVTAVKRPPAVAASNSLATASPGLSTPAPVQAPKPEAARPQQASVPPPVVDATKAATPQPTPVAASPEATCSGKNPVAYFVCMERECLRSEMVPTPDCQKWRQNARHD